jgi:hypothetical protein
LLVKKIKKNDNSVENNVSKTAVAARRDKTKTCEADFWTVYAKARASHVSLLQSLHVARVITCKKLHQDRADAASQLADEQFEDNQQSRKRKLRLLEAQIAEENAADLSYRRRALAGVAAGPAAVAE